MRVITFSDIKKLNITPKICCTWVEKVLLHKHEALLPQKINMVPMEGVYCNVMPCIIPSNGNAWFSGVKIINRYPGRQPSVQSSLILLDTNSGEQLAIMDANWITTMRTGAVAAHSINLFAKQNFERLGIIGLGNTSRAALLCLNDMFENRELYITLYKYKGQEESFIERFRENKNMHFSFSDSYRSIIKECDVIISAATYFGTDIAEDSDFRNGVLVVPIHVRGFTNCDLFFDKIYGDDYTHISHFKNFNKFKSFAEISDVMLKKAKGRENNDERIIAYSIGLSLHDIYFASQLYELLKDNTEITSIDLKMPAGKFWI